MRRALPLAILVAGCGDKAIDVSLKLPASSVASMYDTSCVKSVEVFIAGANYPDDLDDATRTCVQVNSPAATFSAIKSALHNSLDTKLPASGLGGIGLYGYNGPCDEDAEFSSDLVFFGTAPYLGDDSMTLELIPNLSCAPNDYTIRPIDLLKYAKSGQCAQATWDYGTVALSTLAPAPFKDNVEWWIGLGTGNVTGTTANVHGMADIIGPKSCLATGFNDGGGFFEVQCVAPIDQRLCATGGEIEQPLIEYDVLHQSVNNALATQYGGFVVGLVAGPAALPNATVTIDDADKDKAAIVYLDMQPGAELGTGTLTERMGATATGPSGLFAVYTHTFVHVTVTANGHSVSRVIGGVSGTYGAMFFKM